MANFVYSMALIGIWAMVATRGMADESTNANNNFNDTAVLRINKCLQEMNLKPFGVLADHTGIHQSWDTRLFIVSVYANSLKLAGYFHYLNNLSDDFKNRVDFEKGLHALAVGNLVDLLSLRIHDLTYDAFHNQAVHDALAHFRDKNSVKLKSTKESLFNVFRFLEPLFNIVEKHCVNPCPTAEPYNSTCHVSAMQEIRDRDLEFQPSLSTIINSFHKNTLRVILESGTVDDYQKLDEEIVKEGGARAFILFKDQHESVHRAHAELVHQILPYLQSANNTTSN